VGIADIFGGAKASTAAADARGRLGWFEGVHEARICGWTYDPERPEEALKVTIVVADGDALTLNADRLRADVQAAGSNYHGFSAPLAMLPGAARGATCVWSDDGLALPGSPWTPPRHSGRRFGSGSVVVRFDSPLAGDPRLTGYAFDRRKPLRRVSLRARDRGQDVARTVASLYRREKDLAGDSFHGFVLSLPAPLRTLAAGLDIIEDDSGRALARLGPKSL
jgi:hypothetical protein